MKATVIMAAYNAADFIGRAIESVLNQSYKEFQFIIINDGSGDKTIDIIRGYAARDARILIDDHANIGKGNSFNRAVELFATGDYLFHMDADDLMLPDRIKSQLDFLESSKIDAASCLAYYIDKNDRIIGKTYSEITSFVILQEYILKNEPIGLLNPGFVVGKDKFAEVGGYRGKFWPADDIDLYNRLTEIGVKILVQEKILMSYRIHGSSIITSKFLLSRLKFEWVRESMRSRRKGKVEPTWDEFLLKLKMRSLQQKLNWKRKAYAKHYYRMAGFDFAQKAYISFFFRLLFAAVLQPMYVLNKIRNQRL